jgi:hypothetical protein
MTKKISLELPEKDYETLSSLGKLYNKDGSQVILDLIDAVSTESYIIEKRQKESKVSIDLYSAIHSVLFAGRSAIDNIFNPILERFGAKGLYLWEDNEFDLDGNYIMINFESNYSNLAINEFAFFLESGVPSIIASAHIENEKINIEKLRKLIEEADCPETEDYAELDSFETMLDEDDEESATIQINLSAETIDDFPNIRALSKFVEKLLKKAKL